MFEVESYCECNARTGQQLNGCAEWFAIEGRQLEFFAEFLDCCRQVFALFLPRFFVIGGGV